MESYRIDTNAYPDWTTCAYRNQQAATFATGSLTTPIAYLTAMPVDIFSFDERHWMAYCAAPVSEEWRWAIWSAGPDGDYDLPGVSALTSPEIDVRMWDYDETNGVLSDGDIITVSE